MTCLRLDGVSAITVILLLHSRNTDLLGFCGEVWVDKTDSAGDCDDGISKMRRFSGVASRLNRDLDDFPGVADLLGDCLVAILRGVCLVLRAGASMN